MPANIIYTEVDGQKLQLSNLEKVLYPTIGVTKAQIIQYYLSQSDLLLKYIGNRGLTLIRYSQFPADSELFKKEIDENYFHGMIKAEFDAFSVYAMYLPHKKKHTLFKTLVNRVAEVKPMIFCGDMNTGLNYVDQDGHSFWYEDDMKELLRIGMVDAFRYIHGQVKEYSWYSHQGNGYRYDHTLIHQDLLPLLKECYYVHDCRVEGHSDHSPMVLILG